MSTVVTLTVFVRKLELTAPEPTSISRISFAHRPITRRNCQLERTQETNPQSWVEECSSET